MRRVIDEVLALTGWTLQVGWRSQGRRDDGWFARLLDEQGQVKHSTEGHRDATSDGAIDALDAFVAHILIMEHARAVTGEPDGRRVDG